MLPGGSCPTVFAQKKYENRGKHLINFYLEKLDERILFKLNLCLI